MPHALGRVAADGRRFSQAAPFTLLLAAGAVGGPRFVFLHVDSVALGGGARLEQKRGDGIHLSEDCALPRGSGSETGRTDADAKQTGHRPKGRCGC